MSNYIEFENKIAFHPGYYIKEYIDTIGLTQEDFANRLGTTPKNISYLIRGEQSLSLEMALKLARMIGTSVKYWLNLQNEYDALILEFEDKKELKEEKNILKNLDYSYFEKYFNLPNLPKKLDEQIIKLREFLNVSSLTVFKNLDMYVHFKSSPLGLSETNLIKANIMTQIATNISLKNISMPKYDKKKFLSSIEYILTLTNNDDTCFKLIKESLFNAGIDFIMIPNITGSKIDGATKKIGDHIMLMINNRHTYSDSFWFTLFHEIGHIINGDFGISFEIDTNNDKELKANNYADNTLIPIEKYKEFINKNDFTIKSINNFSKEINRNPGIILGRLQKENIIPYNDYKYKTLKHKYNFEWNK